MDLTPSFPGQVSSTVFDHIIDRNLHDDPGEKDKMAKVEF